MLVKIEQMAPVTSTVLIQGESGTGKELVAQAHSRSFAAPHKPFIAVNCAALPDTLLESELFGHEKGAFTGATERRLGRFELADTGTILLDEIGEMPPATQVKLLRVLESAVLLPRGRRPSRSRWTFASSRPPTRTLQEAGGAWVSSGDDLYYRLNVLNIYLPPLRERRADIPLLVRRFIREFAAAARPALPGDHARGDAAPGRRAVAGERAPAPQPDRVHGRAGAGGGDPGVATSRADILEGPGSMLPARDSGRRPRRPGAGARVHPPESGGPAAADRGAAAPARRPTRQRVQVIDIGSQAPVIDLMPEVERAARMRWSTGLA